MSNKVYTKGGDSGSTSLVSGVRVSKTDLRIEKAGSLDELNSFIGLFRSSVNLSPDLDIALEKIQNKLFVAGYAIVNDTQKQILDEIVEWDVSLLEKLMDEMSSELPELKNFILPGGSKSVSLAHVCRTVARRTERILATNSFSNNDKLIMKYINRLSDFFFVLARYIGYKQNVNEIIWKGDKPNI